MELNVGRARRANPSQGGKAHQEHVPEAGVSAYRSQTKAEGMGGIVVNSPEGVLDCGREAAAFGLFLNDPVSNTPKTKAGAAAPAVKAKLPLLVLGVAVFLQDWSFGRNR